MTRATFVRGATGSFLVALLLLGAPPGLCADSEESPAPAPVGVVTPPTDQPTIRPRLELHIPSVRTLFAEALRSRVGMFATHVGDILFDLAAASSEAMDPEEAAALVKQVKAWPDTTVDLFIYAPDREGRTRWAVVSDWPIRHAHDRIQTLLRSDTAETLFSDVSMRASKGSGYEITLSTSPLAYLLPLGDRSYLASHRDLGLPAEPFRGSADAEAGGAPLLVCRLNLTGTEQDSGATFFSTFSAFTSIEYGARVDDAGDWVERVDVRWPPISGVGAKMFLDRVKRTFFVPQEAFGSLVISTMMAPAMLDGMAGFGPQVMMEGPGRMEIVGEPQIGPVARHISSTICLTVLPGTGFLPMPDLLIQSRARGVDRFVADAREAIEKVNEVYRDRERPEPWHEVTVRNRTVFYSDGGGTYGGMMMPLVLRPVLFLTEELDASGKQRDYLVAAWTSTPPEALVRRWLDLPRSKNRRYLPATRKTNGQLWVHWKKLYQWVHPYLNVSLSGLGVDSLLPYVDELGDRLSDANLTAKVSYSGLAASHQGPVPMGTVVVPGLITAAAAIDESGDTDLARERLASRRLEVLYHHCKLFKSDHERWPAEVAELDGYVDFAGHPELLKLPLSSRQRLGEWFGEIFESEEEEEDEEDADDVTGDIDDDLYVIEWGREVWRLGYAPGTLLHLKTLYIDQDGRIHRVEKSITNEKGDVGSSTPDPNKVGEVPTRVFEKAAANVANRYEMDRGRE